MKRNESSSESCLLSDVTKKTDKLLEMKVEMKMKMR